MKDLIEITDKQGNKRQVEIITTFELPDYSEYHYIIYRELDGSHNYVAKYKGENIVSLDSNLSELELSFATEIFKGVKK